MHFLSKYKFLAFACCISIVLASCDKTTTEDPQDPQDPNTPENPNPSTPSEPSIPSQDEAMSPVAQKQYLESVGIQLLEYFKINKFNELTDLLSYSYNTYSNYSCDNISSWASEIYQDLINVSGQTSEKDKDGNTIYYNNSTVLIMASNFHSHFIAQNGTWVKVENATNDNLQFEFKDQHNQTCILKLSSSGEIKKVRVANFDDWYDSDYNSSTNTYSDYYDRTQLTIGIPEQIVLTLTCNEKVMLKETLNIDLSSITNEQFDFSKSSINLSAILELCNGYKIELSKASYTPNNLCIDFNLSSNGTSLIKMTTSSDIKDIPSIKLEDLYSFDEDDYDISNTSASNAYAKIDILGKVQVQGAISQVNKYIEYLYSAENNDTNESEFKSYINQANALTKFYVLYDGTETIQASIKLEPFVESGYGSYSDYWYYEPVFVFYDGSSYCSLEAFFYDADFKKVLDTFEQIIEDYSNKFND